MPRSCSMTSPGPTLGRWCFWYVSEGGKVGGVSASRRAQHTLVLQGISWALSPPWGCGHRPSPCTRGVQGIDGPALGKHFAAPVLAPGVPIPGDLPSPVGRTRREMRSPS